MTSSTAVLNIMSVFLRAKESHIREGMEWYSKAHELALSLSPGDAMRGAGVIAAYSPMNRWERNRQMAINTFATGIAYGHTKTMVSCAQRIHDGEYALDVLKGDKTRAFASAIADPEHSTIATIDRHAHDIAAGRIFPDNGRNIGKRVFREFSAAYVEAAELAGIGVAQMQAITWVAWRELKNA